MARKSKYEELVAPKLDTIEGLYRDGLTLEQIADYLGISLRSLCNYKNQYPELNEALRRGNEDAVYAVENSLLRSACGYMYEEQELCRISSIVGTTEKYFNVNLHKNLNYIQKNLTKILILCNILFL